MDDEQQPEEATPHPWRPAAMVGAVLAALFLIGSLADQPDEPDVSPAGAYPTSTADRDAERAKAICGMIRDQLAAGRPDRDQIAEQNGTNRARMAILARQHCPERWMTYRSLWSPPPDPSPTPSPPRTATTARTPHGQRFGTGVVTIEQGSCVTTVGDFFEFAGTVRNTSSRVMSYSITSGLFDSAGVRIGEGLGHAQYVQPGETARWETIGQYRGDGAQCRVVNVDEYVS